MPIDRYSIVEDVMRSCPATIRVFLDFRLACVGCPIATFHTIEDSCHEHGIEEAPFIAALRAAAERGAQESLSEEVCSASTTS